MTAPTQAYRGRFAPTPSGPLHLGSLFTALASWLAARQAQGEWWLRIDDLDRPRCVAGAEPLILQQLEAHGLYWDGQPVRQTAHETQYREALDRLSAAGLLYACNCTRATLAATSQAGPDGPIYDGRCRHRYATTPAAALRLRLPDGLLRWQDGIQGLVQRHVPGEAGDFVVRRADGQTAYQLACVLDEQRMGITEVLRGADLLGSTVQQLALAQALGIAPPRYAHVPVMLAGDGRKLSKQNGAAPLGIDRPSVDRQLRISLSALQLPPPLALHGAPVGELLAWAVTAWDRTRLPPCTALPPESGPLP